MGSCKGYQVQGFVRIVQTLPVKQIVVELIPSCEVWDQLCGFCYENQNHHLGSDENSTSAKVARHTHQLKGSLVVVPGQASKLLISLSDCGNENTCESDNASQTMNDGVIESTSKEANKHEAQHAEPLTKRLHSNVLQYEIDGKLFELQSSFPKKKLKVSKQINSVQNHPNLLKPGKPHEKEIEFITDQTNANVIQKIDSKLFEEACKETEDKRSTLKRTLETLKVI